MDVLHITPPFSYTYQCGSTLLTAYLPIYMYSISLQIISRIAKLVFIFSANRVRYPEWVTKWFPGIYWPLSWSGDLISDSDTPENWAIPLIRPYQIISSSITNFVLMLSFGLCCPILGCYIALNLCLDLCCWLMLIGRYVSSSLDLVLIPSAGSCALIPTLCPDHGDAGMGKQKEVGVRAMNLLNQQLQGFHSSVLVCKWPVTLTSCFFITLLCWEMAGDRGGWDRALWVPVVGVVMVLIIGMWDRALVNGTIAFEKVTSTLLFGSDGCDSDSMPNSVELFVVRSSFHHCSSPESSNNQDRN
jgi:hypothetical protein